MLNRVLLNVKRFKQEPACCAIAAVASMAHFFNTDVLYKDVKKLTKESFSDYVEGEGLYTSQQCRLLNKLGFDKVTVITSNLELVDFTWSKLSKPKLLGRMKKLKAYYGRIKYQSEVKDMIEWLENSDCDNKLIIDGDFAKYIRRSLNKGYPVIAAVNWTKMFRFRKGKPVDGDIKGDPEYHAFVIRGYDEEGVFVVDSHHRFYTGKRSKFKKGYYKISWEKFLTNSTGDLILL